jgi:YesN/AraC family two-component response regulator
MFLLKRSFFRKVFFSYFIVIGLIISVFGGIFYRQICVKVEDKRQEEYSEWAEVMRRTFDRKFDEIKTIGIQIRNTTWYSHAISIGPYYDEFFTVSTKQEIARELRRYSATAGVADTIALALPQRDEMVSSPGWNKTANIMSLIGIKDSADRTLLQEQLAKPQYFEFISLQSFKVSQKYPYTMAIVQGVDYISPSSRASLLILINNNMMDNYIRKIKPGKLISFSILQDGAVLYTYEESGTDQNSVRNQGVVIRLRSQSYRCEYEIHLESDSGTELKSLTLLFILAIVLSFLLAVVASYLLTRISYRPIAKLMRQTETVKQDEFAGIEGFFQKLENEKKEIERQKQLYYGAAKGNFLLGLLRGYFIEENVRQALENYKIPYQDGQKFRVVLCGLTGESDVANSENLQVLLALQTYMEKQYSGVECIELSATENAFILCDDGRSDDEMHQSVLLMQRSIQEQTGRQITICCGTAEDHLVGISKSFQNAKECLLSGSFEGDSRKVFIAGKNNAYYYPTDWEIQLINSLKVGNEETALKIICELRAENIARGLSQGTKIKVTSLIFETIVRVMDELGMDTIEPEREFEENLTQYTDKKQWQYLHTLTQVVCRRSSYSDENGSAGSIGRRMLMYVEQNYHDCALSLKDLSREFELSASAVSRTFKSTAKICFYDYLCRIRMEKAKEIFRHEKCNVAEVARRVGYENDLSFRRAFLRYEGITPRDYAIKHTAVNRQPE